MTSPVPGPGDVITAIQGLTGELKAVRGELKAVRGEMAAVKQSARSSRRIITGLVASLCLDLAVTAGLGYNTVRQNDVQSAIIASDIRQCQLTNVARQQDIAIWNRILQVPASATAAQKSEVADLERLVKIKDAPRDCATAYKAK